MGGNATFSGTKHQSKVISYVAVHIISGSRLGWFGDTVNDVPTGVSGETGGPGDDALLEIQDSLKRVEVQAKSGLTAGQELSAELKKVEARGRSNSIPVVFVVDRSSSASLYQELPTDLQRLRSGRTDRFGTILTRLREEGFSDEFLSTIYFAPADFKNDFDLESKAAQRMLETAVEQSDKAGLAWKVLESDATNLCAQRLRRDRRQIVELLAANTITVKPLPKDARWHTQLDFTRGLLLKKQAAAAIGTLTQLERDLEGVEVEKAVRYRLATQQSSASLQLDRPGDALRSARRALDVDAVGTHALVNAAVACILLGDISGAETYVNRAIAAGPNDENSWGALLQLRTIRQEPPPSPPGQVAESVHYRFVLAQVNWQAGNWSAVETLTSQLLSEGQRTTDILSLHVNAILSAAQDEMLSVERASEAKRLATELVEKAEQDRDPFTDKAYVLLAHAHRHLNESAEEERCLARARELDSTDIDVLRAAVQSKLRSGDESSALSLLQNPAVEADGFLLALRARLLVSDSPLRARADLDAAIRTIEDAPNADIVRLAVTDAAIELDELTKAESVLAALTERSSNDSRREIFKARIAAKRGDLDSAQAFYLQAAESDVLSAPDILVEAAWQHLRVGNSERAIELFDKIPQNLFPAKAKKFLARALFQKGEYVRAQEIADSAGENGIQPDWVSALAVEIAERRNDPDVAIGELEKLVATNPALEIRVQLAQRLIQAGRVDRARIHINHLGTESRNALSPFLMMQVAQLLQAVGEDDNALMLGFQSYRLAPRDADITRALIELVIRSDTDWPVPAESGPDTHVVLEGTDGAVRQYTIYESAPIDPRHNEMDLATASGAGILGRRIGEEITESKGWTETPWRVKSIQTALQFEFNDAAEHYAERFPDAPFFLKSIYIGDEGGISQIARILDPLQKRRTLVSKCLDLYSEGLPPLGAIAGLLGLSVAEAMELIISSRAPTRSLIIEWSDQEGQQESAAAAGEANEVVITRTALQTVRALGLLAFLPRKFQLIAPNSLRHELRLEVVAAEKAVKEGEQFLIGSDAGPIPYESAPGSPNLVHRVTLARELAHWSETNIRYFPRPLESIKPTKAAEEKVRGLMGESSADAVELAISRRATLHADDIGLRKFLPKGSPARSFSTIGMLAAFTAGGVVSSNARDEYLLRLIDRRSFFVPLSEGLLMHAIRKYAGDGSRLSAVFDLLGTSGLDLHRAARITAATIKLSATADLQLLSPRQVARLGLSGLAHQWERPVCAIALSRACDSELRLLPKQLAEVAEVCRDFEKPIQPEIGKDS